MKGLASRLAVGDIKVCREESDEPGAAISAGTTGVRGSP